LYSNFSFFLLAKKLTPKCTRLALGVNAEGQVATPTQIRRRNSIIRPAASFERPEWSYVDQGDILYDTEIEQTRTDEEYVTENEEEQEVERGRSSAAEDQNDSEGLVMDDS